MLQYLAIRMLSSTYINIVSQLEKGLLVHFSLLPERVCRVDPPIHRSSF